MNAKRSTWVWAVILMMFLASAGIGGLWFWRKQREKKRAGSQFWEVTIALNVAPGVSMAELDEKLVLENERLDRYEVLRPVIDELDLVNFWGVAGPDEAMVKLKECSGLRKGMEPGSLIFVASDKDKEMAGKIGGAVWRSYESMLRRERYLLPSFPDTAE